MLLLTLAGFRNCTAWRYIQKLPVELWDCVLCCGAGKSLESNRCVLLRSLPISPFRVVLVESGSPRDTFPALRSMPVPPTTVVRCYSGPSIRYTVSVAWMLSLVSELVDPLLQHLTTFRRVDCGDTRILCGV